MKKIETMQLKGYLGLPLLAILFLCFSRLQGQSLPAIPLTSEWKAKIQTLAPESPRFPISEKKKILLFSLHTGFEHWVIPHTDAMIEILAEKSQAFEVVSSRDIAFFEKETLRQFDAIILNNTCSKPSHRNLFFDQLEAENPNDSASLMRKANRLEKNLHRFVQKGGGLLILHGAITLQNNSPKFSQLAGGSFDYHPPQQSIHLKLEDPEHPLVQAFPRDGFQHVDEPYFFKNAYENLNFKPLLYFDTEAITGQRDQAEPQAAKTYAAWIRAAGKGKVMYASPSHNAHSFENPALLQFYLDGMQYVCGQVACDDSPIGRNQ